MASAGEPLAKRFKPDQKEETEQINTFSTPSNLGNDELVSILQWLPAKNLIQLESISEEWKDLIVPWVFGKVKLNQLNLADYIKWPRQWRTDDDSIDGLDIYKKLLDLMGSYLTSIELQCSGGEFGAEELQLLTDKCAKLLHLSLTGHRMRGNFLAALPPTLVSVHIETTSLPRTLLKEFFRKYPRLRRLRLAADVRSIRQVPKCLARYCKGLTSLEIYEDNSTYLRRSAVSFADVFNRLKHLNVLCLNLLKCFTDSDVESLCANCPGLEILTLTNGNRLVDLTPLGKLKKLQNLILADVPLTDQTVLAVCEGSGATLASLQLQSELLTEVSLQSIGANCHNLAEMQFRGDPFQFKFSGDGLMRMLDTITSHSSWNGPSNNRFLRVSLGHPSDNSNWTNLVRYDDRVAFCSE